MQANKQVLITRYKKIQKKERKKANRYLCSRYMHLKIVYLKFISFEKATPLSTTIRHADYNCHGTRPSASGGGSDGNDACLEARLDSSSYLIETSGTT
jgi:hypothetical protein